MKRLLSTILVLTLTLLCFSGCSAEINATDEHYTDYEGVYITLDGIDTAADRGPVLKVIWHNETDKYISFGLWYTIEYLDGEEWVNIQIADFSIPEIACTLEAGQTVMQGYSTKYFNMLRPGIYRIRTEFYVPDENIGSQSAWATFEVSYL